MLDYRLMRDFDKLAPVAALLDDPGGVMALIVGVEGPSYRSPGAMMALLSDGRTVGRLSSGCIEADLAIHAGRARLSGRPVSLRYGLGSPFADITLPCGGGLDILLVPAPERDALETLMLVDAARCAVTLAISPDDRISASLGAEPAASGFRSFTYLPEPQFRIFGDGDETAAFSALVHAVGYDQITHSGDPVTLDVIARSGCRGVELTRQVPFMADVDPYTAVLFFFHDHDRELPLILAAMDTPAFYIGAQGSRRTHSNRVMALAREGATADGIARVHGPIGLIHSARDPRVLAVSVLAEVLDRRRR